MMYGAKDFQKKRKRMMLYYWHWQTESIRYPRTLSYQPLAMEKAYKLQAKQIMLKKGELCKVVVVVVCLTKLFSPLSIVLKPVVAACFVLASTFYLSSHQKT